jgi:hypothetical protein
MNTHSIILVAGTFVCGLLHAADTHQASVAQAVEQVTIVEKTAAVVAVVSPIRSSRSTSTPPRSVTPPMGGQTHKRFGSYPGRGGSGSQRFPVPFPYTDLH